ncbi:hypothetical protein [Leptospira sp. id769339]|uniref:hypothetical protein n=1 Tax=Leptospira sp. id769339 TaxID=2864221 RepID=UPI00214BE454|nr:hypothetical protein [Leptospira sp. id769339]MCR1795582.1 hypothetical protein [Leptospira sp. id769339]
MAILNELVKKMDFSSTEVKLKFNEKPVIEYSKSDLDKFIFIFSKCLIKYKTDDFFPFYQIVVEELRRRDSKLSRILSSVTAIIGAIFGGIAGGAVTYLLD